ncbi:MAG: prepilin-type N-terminal cleavage/methylation domain-containing protein [Phycisphaerae bacterium]|nr:prepilin-type N-terminal cleavage/methylation domain-containing protein [Phycisphaerae bacterium]
MRKAGFTLIELIVVIAIIAALLAILLPGLQNGRERAKAAACGSNVKQLVFGLYLYSMENETFPIGYYYTNIEPPGGYLGHQNLDNLGLWWINYAEIYFSRTDNKTLLTCPSKNLKKSKLINNVLCGNYGVNQSICKEYISPQVKTEFIGESLKLGEIPRPGLTLLLVDAGYSLINYYHAADIPPLSLGNKAIADTSYIPGLRINKKRDLWPGQESDAVYGRHPNKTINIGFVDGHLSREKADMALVQKTGDGYTNLSPLWLPK